MIVKDVSAPTVETLRSDILHHLIYAMGKDADHASVYDWRMALSFAIRDRIVTPWFAATKQTWDQGRKRVYYLSMEFLIGRMLEDAAINLGMRAVAREAIESLGQDWRAVVEDEPDAALGNGGLGRLAACYMESMATLGCAGYGYGIRYEHGLFKQGFDHGRQVEAPEDWLKQRHPWEFERPEVAYEIGFKGGVEKQGGKSVWHPGETVIAEAFDMPIIGWQGRWANTLRLWSAKSTQIFDLARFNHGDYAAAAEPEALARTLSRVLYPDDTTYQGKELRLKQEYFLTAAALHDIVYRHQAAGLSLADLPKYVAIQMNDTHPAIAGPELVRILTDLHGMPFDQAIGIAVETLGYTNHTLLPEALERWATYLMGAVLPRHMQIIEAIDAWHLRNNPSRPHYVGIVKHQEVRMGELAFITSHKVNGVSALHTELIKQNLFPELNKLHPGRIVNETNGVTPRRWIRAANKDLSYLISDTIGDVWEADLDRLKELEKHVEDKSFRDAFAAAKHKNKVALSNWIGETQGVKVDPAALFDVQVKRIHEYKRQLLNILQTIAEWNEIRTNPQGSYLPRVKIFGGKAAPGYQAAKEIIRLINDVAFVINNDPYVGDRLKVVYPANYNVSMAERLIPASDLSEQISTAGKEASGTGNMKFAMNGALTIGTLDGANVEIREQVGADNFFLFGLTAAEVMERRKDPEHARHAILASQSLQDVLQMIAEGRFSPDEPTRYHGLVHNMWHSDYFLVASDFDAFRAAQAEVDAAFGDPERWWRMAALNTARMGFFSSDRAIRGYMADIWGTESAL
ncbi:glycogen/starch/alpha-glucan phosphorylase [Sinirhodobacter populi]|uniref:Alpha-1,4 glucan phosphorylase n=1 Tax=Paenirhodobacter populi TaxID=2306993 RepID=A0A443KCR2_9RHOB|nr:glycogen/starch/alpha-glucan phosphorylase [Sinirhodobacter populi]RWR30607.1 glycogen/starch/alpha-glucan phosphorylase [Sinirhodobacter populi]